MSDFQTGRAAASLLRRLAMAAFAALPVSGGIAAAAASEGKPVPYEMFDLGRYSVGKTSWDDVAKPVFCAGIGTVAKWDEVFFAAALNVPDLVFSPPDAFFDRKRLLVVSRIVPGSADTRYAVTSLTGFGTDLRVDYTATSKDVPSTWQVSTTMVLAVDAGEWKTVSFVENGKPVCKVE